MLIATVSLDSKKGYATHIRARHFDLDSDEPVGKGGTDAGPRPYELLLSALGACTSITLRMYADRKGWELGTITMTLRHEKSAEGADTIHREIRFSAPIDEAMRARLAEIADKTPVTRTIRAGAAIETTVGAAPA